MDFQSFSQSGGILQLDDQNFLIGYGNPHWSLQADISHCFYFPHFFIKDAPPWLHFANYQIVTLDQMHQHLSWANKETPSIKWKPLKRRLFEETFNDLQKQFQAKELTKAVPFIFEEATHALTSEERMHVLANAVSYIEHYPAYLYGFWSETEGMLGATPERLFTWNETDQTLQTMACAGTTLKNQILSEKDRLKNQLEHQIVIEGIKQSLAGFGSVTIGHPDSVNIGEISHLITPISVKMGQRHAFESLVEALHPTPALGAYPKENGQKWLKSYQALLERQRFGAPAGVKLERASYCYVAIRGMQWQSHQMRLGAGCGVIAESLLENEWEEIKHKLKAIKEIFRL